MLKWLKSTGLSFQSTPDLINRENETFLIDAFANFMFQSTPDLINRENPPPVSPPPLSANGFNPLPI